MRPWKAVGARPPVWPVNVPGKGGPSSCHSLREVKYWVRNLERQPVYSFWLPTSTDRFYPDFVAELNDGRIVVVEYKGAHLYGNDDSREKRDIGSVWAGPAAGVACLRWFPAPPKPAGQ